MADDGTFEEYVDEHPDSAAILDALRQAVADIGSADEKASKSQIAFRRKRAFARAWAPGQYLGQGAAPLVLTLDLPRRDRSPRWKEVVEPRPGRFTHHLELHAPDDIDGQDVDWLRGAWAEAG